MNITLPPLLYAYFGHHRCATSWTAAVMSHLSFELGFKTFGNTDPEMFEGKIRPALPTKDHRVILIGNVTVKALENLAPYRGFHVVRDPRDILISAYFSHRYSHHTDGKDRVAKAREVLEKLNEKDGILAELDGWTKVLLNDMNCWNYDDPDILELKMEELQKDPYSNFKSVLKHLELWDEKPSSALDKTFYPIRRLLNGTKCSKKWRQPIGMPRKKINSYVLEKILSHWSYEKLSGGRKPGEESKHQHLRKGVHGDWKNYFDDQLKDLFKERHGDLVIKLGYEKNNSW